MSRLIIGIMLMAALMVYQSGRAETLSVRQAVKSAFAVHPAMTVARAGYYRALGQRLIDLSPDPASVAIEYGGMPSGAHLDAREERTISLSQEFEFPVRYVWRAKAAGIAVEEARINALIQMLDLEQEVRNAYVQSWMIDERYKILQENAEAANTYAQQIKRMVELGESAPLEQRRAAVEALQARTQRDAAEKERTAVWESFQSLTGIDMSGKELIPPFTIDEPLGFHFDQSYELKEAALQSKLSHIERKAAVYSWLPDFEATYFKQNISGESDPDFWGVEFGMSLPIWFWLGGRGEIQASRANHRAAQGRLEEMRLRQKINREALNQTLAELQNRMWLYKSQIHPLAEEVYQIAKKSYKLGESSYLDVIDSQRTLLNVQLDQLEIIGERAIATSELDRLIGKSVISRPELLKLLDNGY